MLSSIKMWPAMLLAISITSPAAAQIRDLQTNPGVGLGALRDLGPLATTPDHQKRYGECMQLARAEPLKAVPLAEKWIGEGGGLGARHCVAIAMFEAGRFIPAATQLEAIARDMGKERPGLRAELYAQAGQGWMEAGQAENAAAAQSLALDLKADDPDLWIDRGLSYAAMKAWPRAISDFDHALELRPKDIETLVLRAAAWRNAGDLRRALEDAQYALRLAPDHSEALLERGFAYLGLGNRAAATTDFRKVIDLVPAGSDAARRAETGLSGEQPRGAAPAAKEDRKR
jgi:tetratricopeptide (TPR) repeat protein